MEIADFISTVLGALIGAVAGFISSTYLNRDTQRAAEKFANKTRSADLNIEMHKEFELLSPARIAAWRSFRDAPVTSDHPDYANVWLIGSFYIRLAYLIDAKLLDAKDAGKLHGQNAWWWHYHFFHNDRTRRLNEQNQIIEVCRAWELLSAAASHQDKLFWEHPAKSYD